MKKPNPMLIMMKMFMKSLKRYRGTLKRQTKWLEAYAAKTRHAVNRDPLFNTNLKLWLSEAEETFGRRICPCFSPTGDEERDRKLICPCKYMEEDIRLKGSCHCTLFGGEGTSKETFQAGQQRLMKEYQTPMLRNEEGEIDIRKYPIEERRGLRVPDAYHLVKRAAIMAGREPIAMFLEHTYEVEALRRWGELNGYTCTFHGEEGAWHMNVVKE